MENLVENCDGILASCWERLCVISYFNYLTIARTKEND